MKPYIICVFGLVACEKPNVRTLDQEYERSRIEVATAGDDAEKLSHQFRDKDWTTPCKLVEPTFKAMLTALDHYEEAGRRLDEVRPSGTRYDELDRVRKLTQARRQQMLTMCTNHGGTP